MVEGKVVVITGASRGLGAGMAGHMASRGVKLGLCSRSEPALPNDERVLARRVDVTDEEAMHAFAEEVAKRFGPIDLWINNAGVLDPIRFVEDLAWSSLQDHLAINVGGVLHGSRAYIRHLAGKPGVLVNVSSGAALKGYAGWGAYCASKAAVDRLTECLQLEMAHRGAELRAHAVAPGVIETAMQQLIRSKTADEFPMVDKFVELHENDAFSSPAFVADRMLALAFDPAERPDEVVVRLPPEKS